MGIFSANVGDFRGGILFKKRHDLSNKYLPFIETASHFFKAIFGTSRCGKIVQGLGHEEKLRAEAWETRPADEATPVAT